MTLTIVHADLTTDLILMDILQRPDVGSLPVEFYGQSLNNYGPDLIKEIQRLVCILKPNVSKFHSLFQTYCILYPQSGK